MPPLLMVTVRNLAEEYLEEIRRTAGGSFEVARADSAEAVKARIGDAEVMFGFRLDAETLPLAVRLRWVQATGAGVDWALDPALVASPVILTNVSGIHAVQMSEHAIGMMIALTRNFPHYVRRQQERHWDRSLGLLEGGELYEKTLGIIGLGAIGEALAGRAKAFGMHVIGAKRSPLGYRGAADEVVGAGAIERVLAESDYVVNLLPLTPATRGLVSAEIIAAMKPTARFLNLGRGKTVDQDALVEALESGRIAGAALDVFAEEPLPADSPLWSMPNVIVTPHVSGHSPRYWARATDFFCRNLRRYIAGEELLNVVDKELGY